MQIPIFYRNLRPADLLKFAIWRWSMKKIPSNWVVILFTVFLLAGCLDSTFEQKPVVLTFWQVYGGQTDSPMNTLVDRFNQSVGREKGITVNITSISTVDDIHSSLIASVKKHPGAGKLPDLFIAYPKTILTMGAECMVDWKDYLTEAQLKEFVPAFLAEGEIDGRQVLLPVAKSSSALYINATIFDQFSRETGIRYEDLSTWEGMFQAAKRYHQWSGGKTFFKYDDWMHYSMINTTALGGTFFENKHINFQDSTFKQVWGKLLASAVSGEVSLLGGYATTAMMTGEIVCGIESTAAVLYYKDTVTFPDNTTTPLRLKIFPVPIFEGSKRVAIQRGAALAMIKSTPEKERAAAVFAEWITKPENNVPFVMAAGYFPVKEVAYQNFLGKHDFQFQSESYRELYAAIQKIHAEYEFYIPPYFEGYGELEKAFVTAQSDLFKKYLDKIDEERLSSPTLIEDMLSELSAGME